MKNRILQFIPHSQREQYEKDGWHIDELGDCNHAAYSVLAWVDEDKYFGWDTCKTCNGLGKNKKE